MKTPSARLLAFKKFGIVTHDFKDELQEMLDILSEAFDMEPSRAIAFLKAKRFKTTWKWDELIAELHAQAFTVAKVMQADLLQAIRDELVEAMQKGIPFSEFKKSLMPKLEQKGWTGRRVVKNPDGKEERVELGTANRLRIIIETNLQSAYMNGRWQQIQGSKKTRPWIRYYNPDPKADVCLDLNGKVMSVDDPAVRIPPFHYRCKTSMVSISQREMEREGYEIVEGKDVEGIHESFDAAPGRTYSPDLSKYDAKIKEKLGAVLK